MAMNMSMISTYFIHTYTETQRLTTCYFNITCQQCAADALCKLLQNISKKQFHLLPSQSIVINKTSIKAQCECSSGSMHRAHWTQSRAGYSDPRYPYREKKTDIGAQLRQRTACVSISDFKDCHLLNKKNTRKFHIYMNI